MSKGMKHWPYHIQNAEEDARGKFHTVCGKILSFERRTWNPKTVTCPKCLASEEVRGLIAKDMIERIEGNDIV